MSVAAVLLAQGVALAYAAGAVLQQRGARPTVSATGSLERTSLGSIVGEHRCSSGVADRSCA